ncbi:MAG: alpha/beta hydrolase, partial [Actinobacteria bacterium]|nr:alpha/beta hydrolase [Actinomycetota bacterium]
MIVRYGFTRIAAAAVGIATAAAAFVLPTTAVRAADTPAGLDAYYAQVLEWTSCSSGLSCAWLTVPLDYAKPDGQTI